MAQTILVKRGLKVNLPTLLSGELGVCTDTNEVYGGNGTTNFLLGRVMMGTYVLRPNAGISGRLYYVNSGVNLGYIYLDDGSAWQKANVLALSDLTGTIDNIADGTTYAKVLTADITNGHVNKVSDGTNVKTALEIKTHIDDVTKHRIINDSGTSATDLWSAQQINNKIELAKHNIEPQASVKDKDLLTPPTSPTTGDRYIIATGTATGVWVGLNNHISEYNGSAWVDYTPAIGWTCYVDDEQKMYSWNGTAWVRTGGALQTITAGNGLTGGGQADTVTLNIGAGNGIAVGADTIAVTAYKGITADANGVSSNIDASTIVYDAANGNRLMVGTVDGGTF